MDVIRFSLMRAQDGRRHELEALFDELEEHLSQQQGYVLGFRFEGREDPEVIGRVAVWQSREVANKAALLTHTQALRSQIHRLIQPGHTEELADISGNPKGLPST